jgi:hypothetical protein
MSDVRKPNSKSVLKSVTPVKPIEPIQVLVRPLVGFQRLWPNMSGPQARHVCPQPRHVWPNLIPQRLSPGPDISGPKPGSREGGRTCSAPNPDMSGFLTPERLVFQILYKRLSTPSLVVSWFLTICITFWQPLELSPTSLCEIQVLSARFLSWVERVVLWALILSLEHFELRQALVKHLLLL